MGMKRVGREETIMNEKKQNYLISLIVIIVFAVLCYRAFYFPVGLYEKRRMALYIGLVLLIIFVPLLVIGIPLLNRMLAGVIARIRILGTRCTKNWRNIAKHGVLIFIGAVLVYLLTYGVCTVSGVSMNRHKFIIAIAMYAILCVCILFRNIAYTRADILAFLVILIMGSCAILTTPRIPGTVADDDTHYRRTTEVVGFFTGSIYAAEEQVLREYVGNVQGHLYYDEESAGAYLTSLNESYRNRDIIPYDVGGLHYYHIAYIVPACGIMFGRALGLPFVYTFMMGKWFICLAYALLISASIRCVRRGKALFMAVGMIPTMVFLASAYNYDYWIVGWSIWGIAKFVSLFENERAITNRELIDIILTILIGIIPKIVYFPLLFPLLFLPQNRLNKGQQVIVRIFAILIACGICLMLLVPVLTTPGAYSDTRAEGTVSTSGQLQYIMADPVRYIKLLITFGTQWFSTAILGRGMQDFGYVGMGDYWGIAFTVVILAAFLDRDEDSTLTVKMRVAIEVGVFAAYVLVATAMYLGFTQVGSDTILGVQSRYAYPLLVPMLYAIAPDKVRITGKKENWMVALVLLMSLPMIWNLNTLSVALY